MKKYVQARDILIGLTNFTQHPEVFYECAYIHDVMGLKTEAVPFYEKAIVNGLKGEALLGHILDSEVHIAALVNTKKRLLH
ncbi:hypothetical protein [Bacillus arachidis]|uniref:hypothetical protein n=1 Tax=Bacillus arachidis TaxID=2819290 RepID=UPI001FB76AD5|nr:hypothetical protein [Bacillus arachidis]